MIRPPIPCPPSPPSMPAALAPGHARRGWGDPRRGRGQGGPAATTRSSLAALTGPVTTNLAVVPPQRGEGGLCCKTKHRYHTLALRENRGVLRHGCQAAPRAVGRGPSDRATPRTAAVRKSPQGPSPVASSAQT